MMDFLLEHKIAILIASEVLFVVLVSVALLLRYWFRMNKASLVVFILLILNELAVFLLGVLDYIQVGTFSQFQVIVVIFILYALLFGKNDFKKLDRWMQKQVARLKGEPIPDFDDASAKPLFGKEHAKMERQGFYKHLLVFVVAHIVFVLFLVMFKVDDNQLLAGISNVWQKVLIIDFIWSFSYTIWPKKEKSPS